MEPTAEQLRLTIAQLALNGMNLSRTDRNPRAFAEWYDAIADKVIVPEYEVELEPAPLEVIDCNPRKE